MLVENSNSRNSYIGNGSTTQFPITFPFLDPSHIVVYIGSDPLTEEIVPQSQYTITGAGEENGGTLTMNEPVASGVTLTILRNIPITQTYEYTELDNFPAKSHENALAKLTMIGQQLQEVIDRCVKLSPGSTDSPTLVAEQLFEARDEAQASADRAEVEANKAGQAVILGTGSENLEAVWVLDNNIGNGGILNLPIGYFPGRNVLHLSANGVELYPGKDYFEVGEQDKLSLEVRVLKAFQSGALIHAWTVASNTTRVAQEALNAATGEAYRAQYEANRAHDEAINAKIYASEASAVEANRARDEANRARTEADRARDEANNAKVYAHDAAAAEANRARDEANRSRNEANRAQTYANNATVAASQAQTAQTVAQNSAQEATEQADRADEAAVDVVRKAEEVEDAKTVALAAFRCINFIDSGRGLASLQTFSSLDKAPSGFYIIDPHLVVVSIPQKPLTPVANLDTIPDRDGFYLFTSPFPECPKSSDTENPPDSPSQPSEPNTYWSEECGKRIRS